jgi:phosphate/sulfate permease
MPNESWFIVFIILIALVFDFLNGFHDAANSIATVVSTRVLSPQVAVLWAAFFNFVAAFVLGTHVARTIGSGMIDLEVVSREVVLAGLLGAIAWNLITWYYGIPVSSSHALIGGYAGAAVAKAGFAAILPSGWIKTLEFIVLAPLIGAVLGFLLMVAVSWISRRAHPFRVDQVFRRLQLVSAGLYSLGHGGNDAQKTMGIITGLLIATQHLPYIELYEADDIGAVNTRTWQNWTTQPSPDGQPITPFGYGTIVALKPRVPASSSYPGVPWALAGLAALALLALTSTLLARRREQREPIEIADAPA